jgi:hypothetical protein
MTRARDLADVAADATGLATDAELSSGLASKLDLAGGKILQIVRAQDNDDRTTTSTSDTDVTGMSVTITPQKTDSVILVVMSARVYADKASAGDKRVNIKLTDSGNNILSGGATHIIGGQNDGANINFYAVTIIGYVEPATTLAVTYKTRFSVANALTSATFQNSSAQGQMYAIEVSA